MRIFDSFLGCILVGALAFSAVEVGLTFRQLNQKTLPQITQTAEDLDRTAVILGATTSHLEKMSRDWKTSQDQITSRSLISITELNSDLIQMGRLLATGTSILNVQSDSLSALQVRVGTSLTQFTDMSSRLQPSINDLNVTMRNLSEFSTALNQAEAEDFPKIQASLDNIEVITKQTAGVAEDTHTETTLIVGKTRKAFAPQNKFLSVLKLTGGSAVTVVELAYYLSH